MTRTDGAAAPTPKALGLTRIGTGLGPRDFAYAGRGYRIAPVTRRYWRLSTVGGEPIATAGTRGELLSQLDELLNASHHVDSAEQGARHV